MSKAITPGAIVRIAKAHPEHADTKRYVGRTGIVEAAGNGYAFLKRGRGRYVGAAAYQWPLASLKLARTGKTTDGRKRG